MANWISPITGYEVETNSADGLFTRFREESTIGAWYLFEHAYYSGFGAEDGSSYDDGELKLTHAQLQRVKALAASKIRQTWRGSDGAKSIAVVSSRDLETIREQKYNENDVWHKKLVLTTVGDLWSEAKDLLLETKALITLNNMCRSEESFGSGIKLPVSVSVPKENRRPITNGVTAQGIIYGATPDEAEVILNLMMERNWILRPNIPGEAGGYQQITVSTNGYVLNDRMRIGLSDVRKAFLVCRFSAELESVYGSVYQPVGADLKCPIRRVKDVEHVEQIGDRIIQEINEATFVVVDLTDSSFNVAFEAGYALALGKPIVWTQGRPIGEHRLPFDIQGQNVMEYDLDNLGDFKARLEPRIQAAIDKSNQFTLPLHVARRLLDEQTRVG